MFYIIMFILWYILMGVFCYIAIDELTDYCRKYYSFIMSVFWFFTLPFITTIAVIFRIVDFTKQTKERKETDQ